MAPRPASNPIAPPSASASLVLPTEWTAAAAPLANTSTSLTNSVTSYVVPVSVTSTSVRFHSPVSTTTANAGQATRAKARAATFVASGAARRRLGTTPASAIWPPTQIDAASTCRNRRSVTRVGESTATCYRMPSERRQHVAGGQAAVVHRRACQQRTAEHRRRRHLDRGLQVANVA